MPLARMDGEVPETAVEPIRKLSAVTAAKLIHLANAWVACLMRNNSGLRLFLLVLDNLPQHELEG